MSSNATAATARLITATAKAAAPGVRFTTASQGPVHFRVVLPLVVDGHGGAPGAAGLAVLAICGVDGGSRFTATWGYDRRTRKVVINVTDETAREARMAEDEARRVAAFAAEGITVANRLDTPAEAPAAEPVDTLACAACGRSADSEAHALDHAYVIGNELGTAAEPVGGVIVFAPGAVVMDAETGEFERVQPAPVGRWAPAVVAPSGRYGYRQVEPYGYEQPGKPVVMVVQQFSDGTWGPTPARFYADTAAAVNVPNLLIDCGAGWELPDGDTAGFVAYAVQVLADADRLTVADVLAGSTRHPAGSARRRLLGH